MSILSKLLHPLRSHRIELLDYVGYWMQQKTEMEKRISDMELKLLVIHEWLLKNSEYAEMTELASRIRDSMQ